MAEGGAAGGGATETGGATGTGGATEAGGATGTGGPAGAGGAAATGGAGGGAGGGGAAGQAGAAGAGRHAGGGAPGTGGSAAGAGGHAGTGGGAAGAGAGGKGGSGGAAGAGALPNTTIWIAGDFTVMTYPEPNTDGNNMISIYGWGQEIGQFFNSKVTINNQAIGGRSVAFFMWSVVKDSAGAYQCVDTQGTPEFQMSNGNKVNTSQWSAILNGMKAGDFLLIAVWHQRRDAHVSTLRSLPDFEPTSASWPTPRGQRAPHRSS